MGNNDISASAVPREGLTPSGNPVPIENPTPTQSPAPIENPTPTQSPEPIECPAPSESPTPVENPTPTGQVPLESPAPSEGLLPTESPVPSETPTPSQNPLPTASPSPSESLPGQETVESTQAPEPVLTNEPLPPGVWIALGAALAAAVIGTVFAIFLGRQMRAGRRRGHRPTTEEPLAVGRQRPVPRPVTVGKLHQQGTRDSQQDCFSVSPEDLIPVNGLLAVVADGMGGLTDGDKVSQTAVSAMLNNFFIVQGEPDNVLLTLLEQANHQVNCLLGPEGLGQSGSTLVAGLAKDGQFHFVSVGDSRICLYREGTLSQLNREHVFRRELELRAVNQEGELHSAASHPKAAGLTSFLGMGELKYVDMPAQPVAIHPGDKFILMSDGVYNALTDSEMAGCLDLPPEEAAQTLGRAIQEKNYSNQDNYTAVILGF